MDFDNTIAGYDELIHALAVERGLVRGDLPKNKKVVRDAIRALPDGETQWRNVQVTVYGPRMHEARLIEGAKEFFAECRRRSIPVYIVSHKTEYANFGDANVNLRLVALEWLERHGFFAPSDGGLSRAHVFFESTRAEKIDRIKALGTTHFIDDLEETFRESAFPSTVERILLGAHATDVVGTCSMTTWREIHQRLFGGFDLPALAALLRKPVRAVTAVGRGGNGKVFCVLCEDGSRYAAKFYFQRTMDGLDRLDVEFSSFRFLWQNGERCIPEPLAADRTSQVAIYQYVEGADIDPRTVSDSDIAQMVGFAGRLKALATSDAAASLPRAAEACFSFRALYENIRGRLAGLRTLGAEDSSYVALDEFLSQKLAPAFEAVAKRVRAKIGEEAWAADLPRSAWTLSPSDFGFHNALRRPDGSIALLDFEYFGKDDPAKMIADFVLHPGMELREDAQRSYVEHMLECFRSDRDLPGRLQLSYPLFGMKWCLILLNEFVPKFLERREFAREPDADGLALRMRQLARSQRLLARIMNESERFAVA